MAQKGLKLNQHQEQRTLWERYDIFTAELFSFWNFSMFYLVPMASIWIWYAYAKGLTTNLCHVSGWTFVTIVRYCIMQKTLIFFFIFLHDKVNGGLHPSSELSTVWSLVGLEGTVLSSGWLVIIKTWIFQSAAFG
jgi:hypothetical protein